MSGTFSSFYGVSTKRLNEQVKPNRDRFPDDFMFQLTFSERSELVAKCDHLARLKFAKALPYAFTEHGAIMAASVLNVPGQGRLVWQMVKIHFRASTKSSTWASEGARYLFMG